MTLPAATTVRTSPAGADGVNVLWDFPFRFRDRTHIRLFVYDGDDVETEISSALFSVTAPGPGGVVTYPLAPLAPIASPNRVVIERTVPYSQPDRIGNQGAFQAQTHENLFDFLEMQIQQIGSRVSRTFYVPEFPPGSVTDYRLPELIQGRVLTWGPHGIVNSDISFGDIAATVATIDATAELTLGYAALAVNALQTMVDAAVIVANGGQINNALLITYAGDWASLNVAAALDEAKAASVAEAASITTLQGLVTTLQTQVAAILAGGLAMPIGGCTPFVGGVVPDGFALMYGQTVGKAGSGAVLAGADYEPLFDALAGSVPNTGAEVFATGGLRVIPDMRGRGFIGRDNMGGAAANRVKNTGAGHPDIVGNSRGAAGGLDRHTLVEDELPKHGHPFRVSTSAQSDAEDGSGGFLMSTNSNANQAAYTGGLGSAVGHQIGPTGGDVAHSIMPPSLVGDWLICTGVL